MNFRTMRFEIASMSKPTTDAIITLINKVAHYEASHGVQKVTTDEAAFRTFLLWVAGTTSNPRSKKRLFW